MDGDTEGNENRKVIREITEEREQGRRKRKYQGGRNSRGDD